jgi:hypothetical protein
MAMCGISVFHCLDGTTFMPGKELDLCHGFAIRQTQLVLDDDSTNGRAGIF